MTLEFEIVERPEGRYYKRGEIMHRVWSIAGCEKNIEKKKDAGGEWADKLWTETGAWMQTYTGGTDAEAVKRADPMLSAWALECYRVLCEAYASVEARNERAGTDTIRNGRSPESYGESDAFGPTDIECFGEPETAGESPGMEMFGPAEESFGEEQESFGP